MTYRTLKTIRFSHKINKIQLDDDRLMMYTHINGSIGCLVIVEVIGEPTVVLKVLVLVIVLAT